MKLDSKCLRSRLRWALALLVILAAAGLGMSCRAVTDPAASVALSREAKALGTCITDCNEAALNRIRLENRDFQTQIALCRGNHDCILAATARHADAMQQIEKDRLDCISSCHHQGGASGGR